MSWTLPLFASSVSVCGRFWLLGDRMSWTLNTQSELEAASMVRGMDNGVLS